ncbi:hypothetical protein BGX38DRAFT_1279992 [Terfezia claveryi]|nr:hypothetical protein BGX38DRAFT_1279992 [Terfezia claveryi]
MATLSSLPNELLTHILSYLPSLALLRLLPLSLRIQVLTIHLLHRRINTALALENHYLTFECYPPGERVATPVLHCTYLGTCRRSDAPLPPATSSTFTSATASTTPNSIPIGSLYCHFRFKHALPFIPTPSLIPTTTLPFFSAAFTTPLTVHSSLVRAESSRLLTSAIEVFDKTIYVPHTWLMRAAERTVELFGASEAPLMHDTDESVNIVDDTGVWDKDRILWFGDHGLAGLKLRVTGRENLRQGQQQSLSTPVHTKPDVTYTLKYEQLMVKTVHLLVMLEKSREERLLHIAGSANRKQNWEYV